MKKEILGNFYLQYRMQIFTSVVAMASLFLTVFVIYPQTVKLLSNQQKIEEVQKKSKFLENKVTALESFDEENLAQNLKYVMTALPDEKDFADTLSLFKTLSEQSGFTINSITFGSAGSKLDNVDSYTTKLEIRGPKIMVSSLLSNFENSNRVLKISNIEMSLSPTSQSSDTSLMIEVMYSSSVGGQPDIDAPLPELTEEDEEILGRLAKMNKDQVPFDVGFSPRGKSNPFE